MIPEEIEELIHEGYSFYEFNFTKGKIEIRFHRINFRHVRYVSFLASNPEILSQEVSDGYLSLQSDFLFSEKITRQIAEFIFDFWDKGPLLIFTCRTIRAGLFIFMQMGGEKPRHIPRDTLEEVAAQIPEIDFPHIIAPVAGIICEYADCSLYNFLVKELEKLSMQ